MVATGEASAEVELISNKLVIPSNYNPMFEILFAQPPIEVFV